MRRIWFCFLTSIAVGGLLASPVAAQTDLVDPGLDSIMKTVPAGYQRAVPDRIPKGPMTAEEFNDIGSTDVPERNDHAVFYGATYGKPDGSIIVFLAMSTTHQGDAQEFADGVMQGTFTDGVRFSTGVAGAGGIEGELNGAHVVAISLARNGRGFALLSFGASEKVDAIKFASVVAGVAQSTPTRSDTTTIDAELSSLIGTLAFLALVAIAIVGIVRFVGRRKARAEGAPPPMTTGPYYGMPMNPWQQNNGTSTVERPERAGFPPPPPPPPRW